MLFGLISFALLALGVSLYLWALRRGIYRRIPYAQYLLVGAASALALFATWKEPSVLNWAVLTLSVLVLGAFIWFIHFESKFPRKDLRISIGERFPCFSLPNSRGGIYESNEKHGIKSVLYLFYRGDW